MKLKNILRKFSENVNREKQIQSFKKYNALFKLSNRTIVSVTGEDASTFLQSMITNDMRLLKDDKVSIGALFLNPKGRIIFDSIIVKSNL